MDITLNEQQRLLKETARAFLRGECPKEFVRAMEADERGYAPAFWKKLAELGWLGYILPEAYGGGSGDLFDLGLLVEEMGYAAMPGPFFSTVVLGASLVQELGSEEQKRSILPRVASGEMFLAVAFMEPQEGMTPESIGATATRVGDHYVLTGTKLFVHDAHIASRILCVSRSHNGPEADRNISVLMVPGDAAQVKLTPLVTAARDKQFEVVFEGAAVPARDLLGEPTKAWPAVERVLHRAAALKSVEMVGGMQAALDLTVDYAKRRIAFGRPIATFQAVQHHLASMYRETQTSRLLAYEATWRLSRGLPASRAVSLAKSRVNRAAGFVTETAHQIYGGVGYYIEAPLEIYTRRAIAGRACFGDTEFHLNRAAEELEPAGR